MTKNIIVLHGWALKINSGWQPFLQELRHFGYQIYFPKIPGLTGPGLKKPWDMTTYAQWLSEYIKQKKIKKYTLIGHSFGGSIAFLYASYQPVGLKALILIDSSGIRKKKWNKIVIQGLSKTLKLLFLIYPLSILLDFIRERLYRLIGAGDYLKTKGVLKLTFQKIVSEDLSQYLPAITVPTLILWGELDRDTPPKEGELMHELIPNSSLKMFSGASHALPFQEKKKVVSEISSFIKEQDVN